MLHLDVTVNYIDDIVPELDDDFVKGLNIDDVSNVKEYRAYVKSQLQANKESEAERAEAVRTSCQAVDNAEIKEIPEELVHSMLLSIQIVISSMHLLWSGIV